MKRLSLISALAAAVLVVAGCSTSLSVEKTKVEDTIKSSLGPQIGTIDSVTCPDDLKGEVGATMECDMAAQGQNVKVLVTVTSIEGTTVNFDMKTL